MVLGGLIGDDGDAFTRNCYSAASINFTNDNGGDVSDKLYMGRAFGRVSYIGNYQNIYSLSGSVSCGGSYTPETIISLNEESMRKQNSYTGFDFTNVWIMPETSSAYKYPTLRPRAAALVSILLGDVTQDGAVTVADAVSVCRHIACLGILNGRISALADVNGDNRVDISDLLLICRYAVGIISAFPIE